MVELQTSAEDPVQLYDELPFITSQEVQPGDRHTPAYIIEGAENKVIGIERNTVVAPEFRDSNGEKLDGSTRVILQKADPQGNPLGNAIVLQGNINQWDYSKMLADSDYYRTTRKGIVIDEREHLHIYTRIPSGANAFDPDNSRITIGDNVTQTSKAVFIRDKGDLSATQQEAVNQASTGGN